MAQTEAILKTKCPLLSVTSPVHVIKTEREREREKIVNAVGFAVFLNRTELKQAFN